MYNKDELKYFIKYIASEKTFGLRLNKLKFDNLIETLSQKNERNTSDFQNKEVSLRLLIQEIFECEKEFKLSSDNIQIQLVLLSDEAVEFFSFLRNNVSSNPMASNKLTYFIEFVNGVPDSLKISYWYYLIYKVKTNFLTFILNEHIDSNSLYNLGLLIAASQNNSEAILELDAKRVDLSHVDRDGNTALIFAAHNGHADVVQFLTDQKETDINHEDIHGNTALTYAAKNGHFEVVRLLVTKIDLNHADKNVWNALIYAGAKMYDEITQLLITKIDLNHTDKNGMTALTYAIARGSFNVVNLLIQKGADVNHMDKNGFNPLMHSIVNGRVEIVRLLTQIMKLDDNLENYHNLASIMHAAKKGDYKNAQTLIKKGLNINTININGLNPLMIAAIKGKIEIAEFITDLEVVNLNQQDKEGMTALMHAAKNGQHDFVEFLVNFKIINVDQEHDDSDLISIMDPGKFEIFVSSKNIIDNHAELNLKSNEGKTAFLYAAANGHFETVKLLANIQGINVNLLDKNGWNVLMHVTKFGYVEIARFLIVNKILNNHNYDIALEYAAKNGYFEIVQLFISNGLLNQQNVDVVLKYATELGRVEIVQLFISNGLLNQQNFNVVLKYYTELGRVEIIQLLIENGLPSQQDLHFVLKYATELGRVEIVQLFISNGLLNQHNVDVALKYATELGNLEIFQLLVTKGLLNQHNVDVALKYATELGNLEIFQLLVIKGLLNQQNAHVVLNYATELENLEIFQLLVTKGLLNQQNAHVVLNYATELGNVEIVQLLIENGLLNQYNVSFILKYATELGNVEIFQLLVTNGLLNQQNVHVVLNYATKRGNLRIVQLLIENGLPSQQDLNFVLRYATELGNVDIAQLMIENGALYPLNPLIGKTALMVSAKNGHLKFAQFLILDLPKLEAAYDNRNYMFTDFTIAVAQERFGMDPLLIKKDSKVNQQDMRGNTALMIASEYGHIEIAQLLIAQGAEVNQKDKNGFNALMHAIVNGRVEIVTLLTKIMELDDNLENYHNLASIMHAAKKRDYKKAQILIKNGSNINTININGLNLLMIATIKGNFEIVQFLSENENARLIDESEKNAQSTANSNLQLISLPPTNPSVLTSSSSLLLKTSEQKTQSFSQDFSQLSSKALFAGGSFIEDITVKPLFTYCKDRLDFSNQEDKTLFEYYQKNWSISNLIYKAVIIGGSTLFASIVNVPQIGIVNNIIMNKSLFQFVEKTFYNQDLNSQIILKDVVIAAGTFAIQVYAFPEKIAENPVLAGFLSGLASDSIELALTATHEALLMAKFLGEIASGEV